MIDIDKDNIISELDVTTCLKNLTNSTFWHTKEKKGLE